MKNRTIRRNICSVPCRKWVIPAVITCALFAAAGCATAPDRIDPFEDFNRGMYDFNEGVDRVLLTPATELYEHVVPDAIREGIGNGFANLGYANVILNDFLQGEFESGFNAVGRMAINSTVGLAGFFDVATEWGLPAHENDFGATLGKWGVESGPYVVLPLLGPSTPRDACGYGTALVTSPIFWLAPPLAVTVPLGAARACDARSRADGFMRFRDEAAIDPYIFTRDAYLQYRRNLIHGPTAAPNDQFYENDFYENDFFDVDEAWDETSLGTESDE